MQAGDSGDLAAVQNAVDALPGPTHAAPSASASSVATPIAAPLTAAAVSTSAPLGVAATASATGSRQPKAVTTRGAAAMGNMSGGGDRSDLAVQLVTQDRIIAALEEDNRRLLSENRSLRGQLRDAVSAAPRPRPTVDSGSTSPVGHDESRPSAQPRSRDAIPAGSPSCGALPPLPKPPKGSQGGADAAGHRELEQARATCMHLNAEIARQTAEWALERDDLERKLQWYVAREATTPAQDALIAEQQQTIHELRAQLLDFEAQFARQFPHLTADNATSGSLVRRTEREKDAQLRALHRRVVELEEALKARRPDSVAEMIRAARPPLTESVEYRRMQAHVAELELRLRQRDEAAQRSLDALRVQSDGLRLQYQQRLERVEDELKQRLSATTSRRIKELEKALLDTRSHYSTRVRELETQLASARRAESKPPAAPAGIASGITIAADAVALDPASAHRVQLAEARAIMLEQALNTYKEAMKRDATTGNSGAGAVAALQSGLFAAQQEVALLNRLLAEAREQHRRTSDDAERRVASIQDATRTELQRAAAAQREEIANLERRHEAEVRLKVDALASRQLLALTANVGADAEAYDATATLTQKELRRNLAAVRNRVAALEAELHAARSENERQLMELRRVAAFQLDVERSKAALALERKAAELSALRAQLDELLSDVAVLAESRAG